MSSSKDSKEPAFYNTLKSWIESNGGHINPSLSLIEPQQTKSPRKTGDTPDKTTSISATEIEPDADTCRAFRTRGLYATSDIPEGQLLIRIPFKLALSGDVGIGNNIVIDSSEKETSNKEQKTPPPSPWLQCLANLLLAKQQHHNRNTTSSSSSSLKAENFYSPYITSLPESFETIHSWTTDQIETTLGGTALGRAVLADRQAKTTRGMYNTRIRPFLNDAFDDSSQVTWDDFLWASQCISTRGFHVQNDANDTRNTTADRDSGDGTAPVAKDNDTRTTRNDYNGPFLLPAIDLLNHSTPQKCTTLRRSVDDSDGSFFVMTAERRLSRGDEVMHSYGDSLNASQLLRTFGFVPWDVCLSVANGWRDDECGTAGGCTAKRTVVCTPAVISRNEIVEGCREVAFEKKKNGIELGCPDVDETSWDASQCWEAKTDFLCKSQLVSEDLLISHPINDDVLHEIVTCCTIMLLPNKEALDELFEDGVSLLDESVVLQDFYLGHLICRSLLSVVQKCMAHYDTTATASSLVEDRKELAVLLSNYSGGVTEKRQIEGLTIKIEEKHCLEMLRRKVLVWLKQLIDDGEEDCSDGEDQFKRGLVSDEGCGSKRIKLF